MKQRDAKLSEFDDPNATWDRAQPYLNESKQKCDESVLSKLKTLEDEINRIREQITSKHPTTPMTTAMDVISNVPIAGHTAATSGLLID